MTDSEIPRLFHFFFPYSFSVELQVENFSKRQI